MAPVSCAGWSPTPPTGHLGPAEGVCKAADAAAEGEPKRRGQLEEGPQRAQRADKHPRRVRQGGL